MTPYEQGFLTKCAEYGVPESTAVELCKAAEGSWWDSAKAIGQDFWNNNRKDLTNLGISAAIGGGLNVLRNRLRSKDDRISDLGALFRGGLYGGLAYGGVRGGEYADRMYNNGRALNWLNDKYGKLRGYLGG